jgi:RNA polymerase sigma-70 factor (ECF subfamily)
LENQLVENLVHASQAGDKQAYAELIRGHYASVYLLCLGCLGKAADAEDAAQEVFLKGYLKIRTLRQPDHFNGWIRQIAKNECMNFLRREKRTRATVEFREELIPADRSSPPQEEVRRAVAALPGDLRTPLLMYYFDGRKVEHVAESLGMSRVSIYRKLKEALGQLSVILRKGERL